MRRGQREADRFWRIGQPLRITKRLCWWIVGRLPDAFDKDVSGVPALQHSATSAIPLRGAMERKREVERGDLGGKVRVRTQFIPKVALPTDDPLKRDHSHADGDLRGVIR